MSEMKMQIPVDATVLQNQNQQLVQQLDAQKIELHKLEGNIKELRDRQKSYDNALIVINKMWNQLVNDLVLLGLRGGGDLRYLQTLEHRDLSTEVPVLCPPEDIILCRFLRTSSIEKKDANSTVKFVQEALASRHAATIEVMKYLQEIIAARRAKNECVKLALNGNLSIEDAKAELKKFHESLGEVESNMREAVKILNEKQRLYEEGIKNYIESHSREQADIKRLSGELEDSMAELEESRRKLAILQMQKHGASGLHVSNASLANGSNSPDKSADKIGLKNLKDSIEDAKALAANRLLELQEAQEDTLILSKQLEDLQSQLKDDKYLVASKPYILSSDKLQHMNAELSRYKGLTEILQADRNSYMAREKELSTKADSADATNNLVSDNELKIEELENQLSKIIAEHNDLELKSEEAHQDIGRKDIKDEIHVMASALSKEMEMMQAQVNRSKEAAAEVASLCEEADTLRTLLKNKASDHKVLADKHAKQLVEIKSLKEMIENLEKERQELETTLNMHGQECFDTRTILEIKESEHKAQVQAELLKATLNEHSLELRVKAANDAEATCQQRLLVAEAGLPELRAKLDAAERDVMELREAIRIKDAEAEAYISEIETIGQAYEDMQTQNQHLLQQVANRDDYNIKLVSDSVTMKQTHTSFISEKQSVAKQLQQVIGSLELFKSKVTRGEEQVKLHITQAVNASMENRKININLEKTKLELANSEKELKWLRSVVSSSEKEYEQNQRRMDELRMELERERNERKRLEEELEEVKVEVLELSPESEEATIHKLQDEIKECKAILKCGVCFDRPKEVVITKCFHLFCNPCIQRNLEIRHRKCPGCGTPFGQNDVRKVNI